MSHCPCGLEEIACSGFLLQNGSSSDALIFMAHTFLMPSTNSSSICQLICSFSKKIQKDMLQNKSQQSVQCLAISTHPVRTETRCYSHGQLSLAFLSQDLLLNSLHASRSPHLVPAAPHCSKTRIEACEKSLLFSSHHFHHPSPDTSEPQLG